MIDIRLDQTLDTPLYHQIAEQIKRLIAGDQLRPGERLPAVRQMARSLAVNPNTVVRAYLELEQERIIVSRRGAGTIVSAKADDPKLLMLRERHLSAMVSDSILEALSLGYTPEELEANFHLQLARWREERRGAGELSRHETRMDGHSGVIRIVGSHDLALNMLVSQAKDRNPETDIEVTPAGSLGGLIALQEGRAHLAGIHLLDEESGEYNYPYVKHILPGHEMAIVHLAYRIQGLMFARDNPKQIRGLQNLRRRDVVFVNRQKGSGTRVLLDLQLRRHGIPPSEIRGYEKELDTHLAVALSITRREADVGLGIEAAARSCDLDFLPLFRERFDLVIPATYYRSRLLSPLLGMVSSQEFRKTIDNVGGYDTSQMGVTTLHR